MEYFFSALPRKTSPRPIIDTERILFSHKWLRDGTLFLRLLPCMNFESAALDPASFCDMKVKMALKNL